MKLARLLVLLFVFWTAAVPVSAVAQNLIVNSGFETAPAAGGDHLQGSGAGTAYYANSFASSNTQTIQGWTFGFDGTVAKTGNSAGQVEWFKAGTAVSTAYTWDAVPPHGGTYAVELNTDAAKGRIYAQPSFTAPLIIGDTYKLTFFVSPENNWPTGSGVTTIQGEVTINGGSVLTYSLSAPAGSGTSTWTQETVTFVATGTNPTIQLWDGVYLASGTSSNYSASAGGSNDINLDDVSLTFVSPEPSTWAAGFLLLGVAAWTERKRLGSLMSCISFV
ncbi:MAG: hypothetical protein WCD79_03940 [Chthoniobacteraceae bacterium]